MNDSEMKDIDKLKNLLSEFGVEFEEIEYLTCRKVRIRNSFTNTDFCFERSGAFNRYTTDFR